MILRLRGVAGATVLATGLLMGGAGGAIATADPDTAGQGAASKSSEGSAAPSRPSLRASLRDVVRSATGATESRRGRTSEPSRETEAAESPEVDADAAADSEEAASAVEQIVAVVADVAEGLPLVTVTDPTLPEGEAVPLEVPLPVPVPDVPDSATTPSTGSSQGTGSSTSPYPDIAAPAGADESAGDDSPAPVVPARPVDQVISTMTTVVVSLGNAVAAVPPVIFALPFSSTPITDVITMLEIVLASVTDSVTAAAQLPSDIAALLGVGTVGTTPGVIAASSHRSPAPVSGGLPLVGLPTAPSMFPFLPAPSTDAAVGIPDFGTFLQASLTASSAPLDAAPAPASPSADERASFLDRAVGALLTPLSLWTLFTSALPGLAGLLIIVGAGIRCGYRQAKAGLAVRVAGIGRFARPGPLGVVRSASVVTLHQRRIASGDRMALRGPRLRDQAA